MKRLMNLKYIGAAGMLLAVLATGLLASCVRESFDDINGGNVITTGKVRLQMDINSRDREQVETRAGEADDWIDPEKIYVVVFDENDKLVAKPIKATKSGEKYYVDIEASGGAKRTIYVIANASAAITAFTTSCTEGTTTIDNMKSGLKKAALAPISGTGGNLLIKAMPHPQPMVGTLLLASGITSVTEINSTGTRGDDPLELERATAKVTIRVNTETGADVSLSNFSLFGASLGNVPLDGHIMPGVTDAANAHTKGYYSSGNSKDDMIVGKADADGKITVPMYCYESLASDMTFVIVKGMYNNTPGYYKLSIINSSGVQYAMTRNTHFTVNITKVLNKGYDTALEAIVNTASNIEAEILVTDSDSHDILSNGQYFLGVSNSDYIVYGDGALTGLLAVTVTTNAPASVTTKTVAATGVNITAGGTIALLTGTEKEKDTPVVITLPAGTNAGTITIKLGNLTKVVTVTRKAALSWAGGMLDDFASGNYVTASLVDPANDWLKFSASGDGLNPSTEVIRPSGIGIWPVFGKNLGTGTGDAKSADAFIARNNDKGRTKVSFRQPYKKTEDIVDVDPTPPTETDMTKRLNLYVGAFWKRSQTGERLIRIQRPTEATKVAIADGAWTATVLVGEDWIMLDKVMTKDADVGWRAVANEANVANGNDADFDDTYKLPDNAGSTVSGTLRAVGSLGYTAGTSARAGDEVIYFRIGLKSKYEVSNGFDISTKPCRYGVVLLTYANSNYTQRIFVRQGEDPDYIFRNGDDYGIIPSDMTQGSRPAAVRFSPYNLTAPDRIPAQKYTGTDVIPANGIQVPENGGDFVSYPSQAGAFFQWANTNSTYQRFAYNPINPASGGVSGWNTTSSGFWDDMTASPPETCPSGYRLSTGSTADFRRPNDGSTSTHNTAGNVAQSEMRQSMYLNPVSGTSSSASKTMANNIYGYYADGYFDRRKTTESVSGNTANLKNTTVSKSSNTVAYIGRLYFNPKNNASCFLPAAGSRYSSNGPLGYAGLNGAYWSSSSTSPSHGWILTFNSGVALQNDNDRSFGVSVRCIRQ